MSNVAEQQWRALLDPLVIADIERQALERAAIAIEARPGNTEKPADQLAREEMVRKTVEEAIKRIEQLDGNEVYQKAWKVAVRAVRSIIQ